MANLAIFPETIENNMPKDKILIIKPINDEFLCILPKPVHTPNPIILYFKVKEGQHDLPPDFSITEPATF
jgi:hypothetical protein